MKNLLLLLLLLARCYNQPLPDPATGDFFSIRDTIRPGSPSTA